jgi:hypothetical protein
MNTAKKIQTRSGNMGKCIFKTGVLIGAMAAAGGIATAKSAALGYLATVGPVPLRFQPRVTKIGILPPISEGSPVSEPKPEVPNPPPVSTSEPTPENTPAQEPIPAEPMPPLSDTPPVQPDQTPDSLLPVIENPLPDPAQPPRSANDLLVITPQILIEYFKPVGSSTNAAGVSVLGPVNFTPPTPTIAPSSRAVYKTE